MALVAEAHLQWWLVRASAREDGMLVCTRCFALCHPSMATRTRARALRRSTAVFLAMSLAGLAARDCPLLLARDPGGWAADTMMALSLSAAVPMCWLLWRQLRAARCPACRGGWLCEQPGVRGAPGADAIEPPRDPQDGFSGPRSPPPGTRRSALAAWCMAIACGVWLICSAWSLAAAVPAPGRAVLEPLRPPWAAACGDDLHGRWADLALAGLTLRLRWCPPGSFTMGCTGEEMAWAYAWTVGQGDTAPERAWFADAPAHRVILTRGFWLADRCCTQELWQAVVGGHPATFRGQAGLPVESVSWDDVQVFLILAGREARVAPALPSEAQWEYACRAGTMTRYSFGDEVGLLPCFANTADLDFQQAYPGNCRYPVLALRDGYAETAPVARFAPNPWGLYDMHGNVQQWCADRYADYPAGPQPDPGGPRTGSLRVIRGGGWCIPAASCRSAERSGNAPSARRSYVGFRLCVPDQPR